MMNLNGTNIRIKFLIALVSLLSVVGSVQIDSANAYGHSIIANFPKSIQSGKVVKVTFRVSGVSRAHCRIREQGQSDVWFNVAPTGSIYYTPIRGFGFVQCFWGATNFSTLSYNVMITY